MYFSLQLWYTPSQNRRQNIMGTHIRNHFYTFYCTVMHVVQPYRKRVVEEPSVHNAAGMLYSSNLRSNRLLPTELTPRTIHSTLIQHIVLVQINKANNPQRILTSHNATTAKIFTSIPNIHTMPIQNNTYMHTAKEKNLSTSQIYFPHTSTHEPV